MSKIIDFILAHPILDLIAFFEIRKYLFIKKIYPYLYSFTYSKKYEEYMVTSIAKYMKKYHLKDFYVRRSLNRRRLYVRAKNPLSDLDIRDGFYFRILDYTLFEGKSKTYIFDYRVYDFKGKRYFNMNNMKEEIEKYNWRN